MKKETKALIDELRRNRVEQPAWVPERYIGTRLKSFGTRKPAIHSIASRYVAASGGLELGEIHAVVDELWHAGIFDARSLAASILKKLRRRLDRGSFDLVSKWYDDVDNWANCDDVSVFILAEFMFRDEEITSRVSGWVDSSNP
ncbi:MAG: DNA alkylation repair protein, partial [Thermoplasmata archaeon]